MTVVGRGAGVRAMIGAAAAAGARKEEEEDPFGVSTIKEEN